MCSSNLLSWVIRLALPPAYPTRRFLPQHPEEHCFGCPVPPGHHVPPSWFLSNMTVCSARQPQVYCNLVPTIGFIAFPPSPNPSTGRIPHLAPVRRLPRNAVHTPQRIPLVSSRTASLRPLPSCGCHLFRLLPTRSEERVSSHSPHPRQTGCACTLWPKPSSAWRVTTGTSHSRPGRNREASRCARRLQQGRSRAAIRREKRSHKTSNRASSARLPPESDMSAKPHPPKRARHR